MTRLEADLRSLCHRLRQGARRFSAEAERATREADQIRCIATAVTLDHIANDV
jgi:hypothetical protein